MPKIL